jgi:hypothetical protein
MVAISYLTGNKAQMADMNSQLANMLKFWYVTIVENINNTTSPLFLVFLWVKLL